MWEMLGYESVGLFFRISFFCYVVVGFSNLFSIDLE